MLVIRYNMARSDVSDLQSPITRALAPEGEVTVNQIYHKLAILCQHDAIKGSAWGHPSPRAVNIKMAEAIDDCYEPVSKRLRSKRPEEEIETPEEEMETPEEEIEMPEEKTEMPEKTETERFVSPKKSLHTYQAGLFPKMPLSTQNGLYKFLLIGKPIIIDIIQRSHALMTFYWATILLSFLYGFRDILWELEKNGDSNPLKHCIYCLVDFIAV